MAKAPKKEQSQLIGRYISSTETTAQRETCLCLFMDDIFSGFIQGNVHSTDASIVMLSSRETRHEPDKSSRQYQAAIPGDLEISC